MGLEKATFLLNYYSDKRRISKDNQKRLDLSLLVSVNDQDEAKRAHTSRIRREYFTIHISQIQIHKPYI